jgi:hypothetical protein
VRYCVRLHTTLAYYARVVCQWCRAGEPCQEFCRELECRADRFDTWTDLSVADYKTLEITGA